MSEGNRTVPVVRQGELIREISSLLPQRVEGEWRELILINNRLSMVADGHMRVTFSDGTSGGAFPPRETSDLLEELRDVMYSQGSGTWFSATFRVVREESGETSANASFNYDEEPEWNFSVDPVQYAIDLEDFPRDEENIPGWLRERLSEAKKNS